MLLLAIRRRSELEQLLRQDLVVVSCGWIPGQYVANNAQLCSVRIRGLLQKFLNGGRLHVWAQDLGRRSSTC